MAQVTLEKLNEEIQEIKLVLHKMMHVISEDFELSENVKKELAQARSESIVDCVDHKDVLEEFA
jgi:hypothetical protein